MATKKCATKQPVSRERYDDAVLVDVSSSSDSDDEDKAKQGGGAEATGKAEDAKTYQMELKDEVEQVTAASDVVFINGGLKSAVKMLMNVNSFFHANYQDILPLVIDGRKFLIDGDSLLMHALNSKGLCLETGGTTLHVVYLVEKFLATFRAKGLNFVLIFFEVWEQCWTHFPKFNIARCALKLHFMHNQSNIVVLSMKSLWSDEFSTFIQNQRPGFLMAVTSLPDFLQLSTTTVNETEPLEWLQFVLYSQAVCCEFLCLDVVDVVSVQSTAICLMATVHAHMNEFKQLKTKVLKKIKAMDNVMPVTKTEEISDVILQQCVRTSALTTAVALTLRKDSGTAVVAIMQIILLYATVIEYTPLKMRCFPKLEKIPKKVSVVLVQFQRELVNAVITLSNNRDQFDMDDPMDFTLVGDLWHGRLFQTIYHSIGLLGGAESSDLGNVIANNYDQLVDHVNKFLKNKTLDSYPIRGIGHATESPKTFLGQQKIIPCKLIPTTSKLTSMFSGQLVSEERFSSVSNFIEDSSKKYLHEVRHWHSKRPIKDEFERIPDNAAESAPQQFTDKRYTQHQRNTMARWLTIYGASLEGRSAVKSVVTNNPPKKQDQKKNVVKLIPEKSKSKISKKDKIIEENMKRKSDERKKLIKERLSNFLPNFSLLMQTGNFNGAVEKCEIEVRHATEFSECVIEILFLKATACWEIRRLECKGKRQELRGAKVLFLAIREILTISEENKVPLSPKQKVSLSDWLHGLGLEEVAELWKLPEPRKLLKRDYEVGMNHVEFQLAHLGADLNRHTGGKPDPRADGFIPDAWQVELFDIIDKNQSAVVVAPTSSGKTYASYYCMEKVIRESDDGVVVYVCPTKALVNQVQATIYARFKKNLPAGKVLLGTFTRDYRENVMNCQILTTVPECMELLLLSPRSHTWARRLKYVIFDEVHCLAGQSGGLAWENSIMLIRCPFLALSATIHKPETFCSWLQNVEDFKRVQAEKFGLADRSSSSFKVSLVVHSERHNHLKKNVLSGDGIMEAVHPYSFLDATTIQECRGIPQHIALSPDEALELYNAMKVLPSIKAGILCPIEYFKSLCPSGFLSMNSVRKFSEELRTTLEVESMDIVVEVLKALQKFDYRKCETGNLFVHNNITVVLDSLKSRGMLPALVFTYNRRMVQALPVKLLDHLRNLDDFIEDNDSEIKPCESDAETVRKGGNKENRRYRSGKEFKPKLGILRGPSMLKSDGSVRGEGFSDEKVVNFVERRLLSLGYRDKHTFPSLLRRGLGRHFGGMNNKERSAVEILFRLKILNFVSATGTLALGIHMPCKTVVVAGDSPYLNSLEFNQMSGRAGRRGFDKEGSVVLFGLSKSKMQTLMTANLPKMVGNFPLCASLILRLLLLVSDVSFEGKVTEEATSEALIRACTLLEKSLLYESQEELKDKMRYYVLFVNQFLIRQGLLSREGHPFVEAQLVTHLHYHEPGNFAFCYLLRTGVLEKMCTSKKGAITTESIMNLIIVLSFLFAPLPLSKHLLKENRANSIVKLPPLPKAAKKALVEYNKEVLQIFSNYFTCITDDISKRFGEERYLPLTRLNVQPKQVLQPKITDASLMSILERKCTLNFVCSVFAGLSGNTDQHLFPDSGDILHIREDINVKIVPTVKLDLEYNSYALDFYKHGIKQAICCDNGLKSGDDFRLLKDFMLTLKSIHLSLSEMLGSESKLLKAIELISKNFLATYTKAYGNVEGL